jgi:hypothetical protein
MRSHLRAVLVAALAVTMMMAETPATRGDGRGEASGRTVPLTLGATVRPAAGHPVALDFAATHVAFSWRGPAHAVVFRTIGSSGAPTRWGRAREDDSHDPGGRRYSGVVAVPRSTAIEWRPTRGLRDVALHYMNTRDGPRRAVVARARGVGAHPGIVTRAKWGADESMKRTRGGCRRSFWPVQQLFVHHTAGRNRDPYPKATMRAIYYFHTVTRGWCDVGYNFVIAPDGRIFEGRWARSYVPAEAHDSEDPAGRAVRGAHVADFNTGSVGVSLMGNYSVGRVPRAMKRALVRVLAWEVARHHLDPLGRHVYRNPETGLRKRLPVIAGHRHAGQTACPGGNVLRALPAIRKAVRRAVVRVGARTRTSLSLGRRAITFGDSVGISGRLATRAGESLEGRRVRILKRFGRRWRVHERLTTRGGGSFSSPLTPRANASLAAEFSGGPGAWGSDSRLLRLLVRARLRLEVAGGTPGPDGIPRFAPGARVELSGRVIPPKPRRRATIRIARRAPDGAYGLVRRLRAPVGERGAFRASFVPRPGSKQRALRARAWFSGDRRHARGRSGAALFVVEASG